jgi:hypothetical protein
MEMFPLILHPGFGMDVVGADLVGEGDVVGEEGRLLL